MAKIFDKSATIGTTDRTLVLDQREALVYPLPFDNWETLRVGAFISVTTGTSDNAAVSNTGLVVPVVNAKDRIFIGFKYKNSNFPTENSEPFLGLFGGVTSTSFQSSRSPDGAINSIILGGTSANILKAGTLHANNTVDSDSSFGGPWWDWGQTDTFHTATGYARFITFVITVKNRGLSNQVISLKIGWNASNISDTSDQNMKDLLVSNSLSDLGDRAWNLSGVPYSLPDSIFFYFPFTNLRLRVHNISVIKAA